MKNARTLCIAAAMLLVLLPFSAASQSKPEEAQFTAIKAGRLIDTEAGAVLTNQVILIKNGRVEQVGSGVKIPEGAEVIDLSDSTVLPGLIDTHVHITGQAGGLQQGALFRNSFVDSAIVSHIFAKRTLDAGFTTVRDLGSLGFVAISLRNAINEGIIPGPRMQVATYYIGSTGSHGDQVGFSPWLGSNMPEEMSGIADGVDGVRKKVRYLIKYGASVIKFGASAGVLSGEESVGAPQYSQAEMDAIVEEAHRHGVKVTAHAHGTEAIKMAIRAGADSIEHGSMLDDEAIAMMKERGTYLSSDIYNHDYIVAEYLKLGFPQRTIDKENEVGDAQRESFRRAVKAGVKITYGTDAGIYPHGWNGRQFAKMVEFGMSPMQAIQAATVVSAELLGWQLRIGSIKPGAFADIIAVRQDPLKDISALEKVDFVMKAGKVHRRTSDKP